MALFAIVICSHGPGDSRNPPALPLQTISVVEAEKRLLRARCEELTAKLTKVTSDFEDLQRRFKEQVSWLWWHLICSAIMALRGDRVLYYFKCKDCCCWCSLLPLSACGRFLASSIDLTHHRALSTARSQIGSCTRWKSRSFRLSKANRGSEKSSPRWKESCPSAKSSRYRELTCNLQVFVGHIGACVAPYRAQFRDQTKCKSACSCPLPTRATHSL